MFKRLPESDQTAILNRADSEELKRYLPVAHKSVSAQFRAKQVQSPSLSSTSP